MAKAFSRRVISGKKRIETAKGYSKTLLTKVLAVFTACFGSSNHQDDKTEAGHDVEAMGEGGAELIAAYRPTMVVGNEPCSLELARPGPHALVLRPAGVVAAPQGAGPANTTEHAPEEQAGNLRFVPVVSVYGDNDLYMGDFAAIPFAESLGLLCLYVVTYTDVSGNLYGPYALVPIDGAGIALCRFLPEPLQMWCLACPPVSPCPSCLFDDDVGCSVCAARLR